MHRTLQQNKLNIKNTTAKQGLKTNIQYFCPAVHIQSSIQYRDNQQIGFKLSSKYCATSFGKFL